MDNQQDKSPNDQPRSLTSGIAACVLIGTAICCHSGYSADQPEVPNADFRTGQTSPEGWNLIGNGQWIDRDFLEVNGNGEDSSAWWSEQVPMQPGELYHFWTRARRVDGSGSAILGPAFANRDRRDVSDQWQWLGHAFRVPDSGGDHRLRVGQWHASGALQYDAVRLTRAIPIHRKTNGLVLGEGELIRGDQYHFAGRYGHLGSNYHRVLESTTTGFNSDRWMFGTGNSVVYRFALPNLEFTRAKIEFDVNYYTRGGCRLEVSRDGNIWQELVIQSELGAAGGEVPADWFPAKQLLVRLTTIDEPSSFQVNRLDFQATLNREVAEAAGQTVYAAIEISDESLTINSLVLQQTSAHGQTLSGRIAHNGEQATEYSLTLDANTGRTQPTTAKRLVAAGQSSEFALPLPQVGPGQQTLHLAVEAGGKCVFWSRIEVYLPDFYRSDYGYQLADAPEQATLWWCDATRKVPRGRPAPTKKRNAVKLEAARNDFEAAQIVVRPSKTIHGLTATASELTGPGNAKIAADEVQILQVFYHYVHHPTDATGVRDWWPDALPPLDRPLDLAANENQPLWLLIHVPDDTAPGDYTGQVHLTAEDFSMDVPVHLHVWDFALPEENHLETAFGLRVGNIWQYHGLKSEADKRRVLDLYFRSFAEHRISPYDPTPLDPVRVKFLPDADPPRAEVDSDAFEKAMEEAIDRYHFTGVRFPIQGMGGGTFHARYEPKIGRFGENTDEYRAMFSSYVGQLDELLRRRGWLDKAYIYWFDEPAPRDYDFVAAGMQRLKQYAPGLRRMLTEEPADNQLAGLVDIWCPVSHNYNHEEAEKRRQHGERFWWYVCTGPKAPYCTLFIDHPATELRVWHWQTWQHDIVGTLVWQSNYWTSPTAFPEEPQNPYEDPMGYVNGYSTPRGVKRHWGNGDGRFLYPPLAAATPGASGPDPVIAPPVSSIRWEMLREGVEDYEYLYLLRELLQKHRGNLSQSQAEEFEQLLAVPPEITTEMTQFTTDSTPIYNRRRAIAEAIEQLVQPRN